MNCQQTKTLLSSYLDEMLPARDAGSVAGHLARCTACRRELEALESALAVLDRVRLATPPIDLWERFQERLAAHDASPPARSERGPAPARRPGAARGWPGGFHVVLAPFAVAALMAVGFGGYRLGVQSPTADEGVLASALISRAAPTRGEVVHEAVPATVARQTRRHTVIVPPEASMTAWESWGSKDTDPESSPRHPAQRHRAPALPPATDTMASVPFDLATGQGATSLPDAVSPPMLPPAVDITDAGLDAGSRAERVEARASAHLAVPLQASIEEVARRQVTDEVALLAQALKTAGRRTSDRPGPLETGDQE